MLFWNSNPYLSCYIDCRSFRPMIKYALFMPKKMKKKGQPKVHDELKGFDIKVNAFGEMQTNFEIDKLNDFLNENVEDKKLINRNDSKEEE